MTQPLSPGLSLFWWLNGVCGGEDLSSYLLVLSYHPGQAFPQTPGEGQSLKDTQDPGLVTRGGKGWATGVPAAPTPWTGAGVLSLPRWPGGANTQQLRVTRRGPLWPHVGLAIDLLPTCCPAGCEGTSDK